MVTVLKPLVSVVVSLDVYKHYSRLKHNLYSKIKIELKQV